MQDPPWKADFSRFLLTNGRYGKEYHYCRVIKGLLEGGITADSSVDAIHEAALLYVPGSYRAFLRVAWNLWCQHRGETGEAWKPLPAACIAATGRSVDARYRPAVKLLRLSGMRLGGLEMLMRQDLVLSGPEGRRVASIDIMQPPEGKGRKPKTFQTEWRGAEAKILEDLLAIYPDHDPDDALFILPGTRESMSATEFKALLQ
ncbi:MAG: hypothetical protein WC869_08265 [Phycisphaerae bacterium]